MRSVIFILLTNLLSTSQASADDRWQAIFPVLGYAEGSSLYVRTYRNEHGKIPETLFAYGDGKEFVGKLRKEDSFLAAPSGEGHDCYDDTFRGQFVYEMQQTTGMAEVLVFDDKKKIYEMRPKPKQVDVLIFDTKRNIRSSKNKWVEVDSHTEWEILNLTSNEGVHEIVRSREDGKCIGHIDYYTHCDYATEADSVEAFKAAMCGKRVQSSGTGF